MAIKARKNIETDNPKFGEGRVWCKVLKSHVKGEFSEEYEKGNHKAIKLEHTRQADDFIARPIEADEAYELYLRGIVSPHRDYADPRPRAALKPLITPRQKEAQAYLDGDAALPSFIEDFAKQEANRRTTENRNAVRSKALGEE